MSLQNGSRAATAPRTAATLRAALVAALGTVPGVSATPSAPDHAVAGAGWVKWIQTVFTGHLCTTATDTYEVLISLPHDYLEETVDQGDAFRELLVPALTPVAVVELVEPVQFTFNDRQTAPGLRARVHTR